MTGSEEQHAAAVIAALTATNANPFDLDDVPKTLPAFYTEVTVTRRFGGAPRQDGRSGTEGYRVTARAVAKNVSNARETRRRQHAALEYAVLSVAGKTTTPIQFEASEPIGNDEGWYSGLETWTYAI